MNKEKGFLAYYNLLIMIVILASLTTITIRNLSVKYYYNAYFHDCYTRSLIENIGYKVLNELKNHENYSFSVNEKITDNDIYISGSSSIVNKKQKKYKVSVRVDYFVLYRWGYTLTINCSLVDDKVVIEDWGGKYG